MWMEHPRAAALQNAPAGEEKGLWQRESANRKKVCVCIYLCVSLVFAQIDIVSKRQQLENLTQQVAAQEAANTELQRTLDSGDEAAYMERIARDKLGYVLPGEHIYVDMSGD